MMALLPPLPEPSRTRWQPLRLGLVEIYHYDVQEFWFLDGRLLLRGNNGTGKSKVLSLALPFLLDANLSPARVEPDGDRTKRMEWNLLMGRHERRTGYTWIEFGRRDDDGDPHYLTLGCGMTAVSGRSRVDAWHFLTSQRIGIDLWLVSPEQHVLSQERLTQAMGTKGRVFPSAREYRRAVDERLFQLGEARYDALMDTLIQLRQPQLSKKPDEGLLSDALTQALPPLSQTVVEDVAEAMSQLDNYRTELDELVALRDAVAQFGSRYRTYARVQSRRQAAVLRQAQTRFDDASRELNAARMTLSRVQAQVKELQDKVRSLDEKWRQNRARHDELRNDPKMRDALRLRELENNAEKSRQEANKAEKRNQAAQERLERERRLEAEREAQVEAQHKRWQEVTKDGLALANDTGIAADYEHEIAKLDVHTLHQRTDAELDATGRELRQLEAERRKQTVLIRERLQALGEATTARERAQAEYDACADTYEAACIRVTEAQAELKHQGEALCEAWRSYLAGLISFDFHDAESALAELAQWVDSQTGENPLHAMLHQARIGAERSLERQRSDYENRLESIDGDILELRREQSQLEAGEDRRPPIPYTRTADMRTGRAGAPLWQLLEFRDSVPTPERAGIEAALEAAGLLDAWLMPDGRLLDPTIHDVILVARTSQDPSLLNYLRGVENSEVSVSVAETLLSSIACGENDVVQAEVWVSPNGRFRFGPAQGSWAKDQAEYIGYAAREATRRRRLAEIAASLNDLTTQREQLVAELRHNAQRLQKISEDYAAFPRDDKLIEANAACTANEQTRRAAQDQLARAEAQLKATQDAWSRAHDALELDAADLRLSAEPRALADVEHKLTEYVYLSATLIAVLRELRNALRERNAQRERVEDAQREHEACEREYLQKRDAAIEDGARASALRETIGAEVEELERRLAEAAEAVREGEGALNAARETLSDAKEQQARSDQKAKDAEDTLNERSNERQQAVDHLRAFAATGLLAVALPELEQPEPDRWTIEPALTLARRTEQMLSDVTADEVAWNRIQTQISHDFTALSQTLSARGQQAQMEQTDYGLIVQIVYANRAERPDMLERRLEAEITEREEFLNAREREVLENHLEREVAAHLQRLLRDAERWVNAINQELYKRPTSTGVRFRLDWEMLPEGDTGDSAPAGLAEARRRLLNRAADAWSADDRRLVGQFLQARIAAERQRDNLGPLAQSLAQALDYRRWHRFRVKRFQDGAWRPLSGPASSGERALGLTVPLFAAASSHYASCGTPHAPRLVLLDEAFVGIDDAARAHCMGLIHQFDLDLVMTSEREWGCYKELPGLSICQLTRQEGIDAVHVSPWSWNGLARRAQEDGTRRVPAVAAQA